MKNFIYLNTSKLYSFSSQLFEGITEYVLNEEHKEIKEEDVQKGRMATGRVIANVIRETSNSKTKKFLHDYSFNLFEQDLISSEKILDVTATRLSFDEICTSNKSFIKIRAKGKFIDLQEMQTLFGNFSKISEALAILPAMEELQELELCRANEFNSAKVKTMQSELDKKLKKEGDTIAAGMPKRTVECWNTIMDTFGDDIVRFQQEVDNVVYSTCLSQEYLRENLKMIYRKYSRKTAKEFIVIGFISHADGTQEPNIDKIPEGSSMLAHMIGMSENMYDLEQNFSSKADNEIIIDPIAIYTEL
ncbi:hypothetical protein VXS05_18350 [Photobacterium toruni]|uniref:DUF6414 family protein n=1 Tax=Photobacterium toruni TaxID=1935446 RepID=UPI002E17697D|nr:hypothetical protein [Photobacterium toruni]